MKVEVTARAGFELGATQALGRSALVATLTYSPAHLPAGGNVSRLDARSFCKRVQELAQKRLGFKVRLWGVAEYGERLARPHFHIVVFGLDVFSGVHRQVVLDAWSRGGELLGQVHFDDASKSGVFEYIAGYTMKKLTRECDELEGHIPEFVIWPQRPPLGGGLADSLAEALSTSVGRAEVARRGQDAPGRVRVGGKSVSIGRTLLRRVRKKLGLDEPGPKAMRELVSKVRLDSARGRFEGDWYDPDAHVDQAGIEHAEARRRLWSGSKRKRSL